MPTTTIPSHRIRSLRKRLGMTQEQFATALGVARNTVTRWEIDLSAPRGLSLAAVLNLYQMSPEPPFKVRIIAHGRERIVLATHSSAEAKRTMNSWLRREGYFRRMVEEVQLIQCSMESDTIIKRASPHVHAHTITVDGDTIPSPDRASRDDV